MKLLKNLLLSALMLWGGVCATYAQEKTTTAGVPVVKLNNGVEMPRFGIGTFLQPSDEVCEQSCLTALKAGYRHIDTAHAYQDEAGVGRAVKESGIPREEIWITSKLWPTEYGEGKTLKAIDEMLDRMQLDYIAIRTKIRRNVEYFPTRITDACAFFTDCPSLGQELLTFFGIVEALPRHLFCRRSPIRGSDSA